MPYNNQSGTGGEGTFSTNNRTSDRSEAQFDPLREFFDPDVEGFVDDKLGSVSMPTEIQGSKRLLEQIQKELQKGRRSNPYSLATANQARDGQLSALDQLYNGTSTVGAQAGQAMGQLGRQVSGATAGSSGLEQMMASRAGAEGGVGLAGRAGDARLAEFMNQQKMAGVGYAAARGQDQSNTDSLRQAGFDNRRQDDALENFYRDMSNRLDQGNLDIEQSNRALRQLMIARKTGKNIDSAEQAAETAASIAGKFVGA